MSTEPREQAAEARRDTIVVSTSFWIAAAAAIGLGVLYWEGGQPQVEGVLLAVAGTGIAVGMITWAHRLLPQGPFVEDHEPLASPEAEREKFEADLERGGVVTSRRWILRSLGAAIVALGGAFLLPLRSLGPRPRDTDLNATPWIPGRRLVTADNSPIVAAEVPPNSLVSVFPEDFVESETGQAVLVRVDPALIQARPGREAWTPGGLVAYSKLCTHAGCPVGLFEAATHQLLCPCHQSTFDVLRGAKPIFGPAAVALPQLPLLIDAAGFVRAAGDFSAPPGPSFWNRSR
jgi:ubiquinol-cytochrome c reductase iron-sulfur subunit